MPRLQRPVRRPARFDGVTADKVPVPPKKKKTKAKKGSSVTSGAGVLASVAAEGVSSGHAGSSATSTTSSSGSTGGTSQLQGTASIAPNPLPSVAPMGGEYCNANHANVNITSNVVDISNTRPEPVTQIGINTPLGFHVPQNLKEKIWEGAYVDFALLYKDTANAVVARAPDHNLQFVVDGDQLVLRKPGPIRKKLETLDMWQSAFHTYMAIYVLKHPTRCAELLKYAEIVRMAAVQYPGLGWRTYDEQFRLMQESDPGRSWGNLDTELWLTVAAISANSPTSYHSWRANNTNNNAQSSGFKPPMKTGVCFAFNSMQGCHFSGCRFAHTCSKCMRGGHSAPRCRIGGQARWVNSSPSPRSTVQQGQGAYMAKQAMRTSTQAGQFAPTKQSAQASNLGLNTNGAASGKTSTFRPSNPN